MRSKKGALELSMNTIVIIVIGVTLLILGLAFVTGLFDKLEEQRDRIFGEADTQIKDISSHSEKLNVQSTVSIEQGESTIFNIYVVNFNSDQSDFRVEVTPSEDSNPDVSATLTRNTYPLKEGQEATFGIVIEAENDASLNAVAYNVDVYADNEFYAGDAFLIKVKR